MENIRQKFILILASGGGVGFSPFLPGTLGTLVAIPVCLLLAALAGIYAAAGRDLAGPGQGRA